MRLPAWLTVLALSCPADAAGVKLLEAPATPVQGSASVSLRPPTAAVLGPVTPVATPMPASPALSPLPALAAAAAAPGARPAAASVPPAAASVQASAAGERESSETLSFSGSRRFDGAGHPLAEPLAALRARGHATAPAGTAMSRALEAAVSAELSRRWERQPEPTLTVTLLDEEKGWRDDLGGEAGGLRAWSESLGASLREALPGEDLVPVYALARLTRGGEAPVNMAHVDGDYLAATYPLSGEGTVVYGVEAGRLTVHKASERTLTVLSGEEREQATGVPAVVHAAPEGRMTERAVVIVMFSRRAAPKPTAERAAEIKKGVERRLRETQRLLGS